MPHALASAPNPDSDRGRGGDLEADYLGYLRETGRGNVAYSRAARVFFARWPDPRGWAAEPLEVRLSANSATRPIITLNRPGSPGGC